MRKHLKIFALLIVAIGAPSVLRAQTTMTFEGLATNQYYPTPYTENGITLTAFQFWITGPGGSTCGGGGCVDDGTNVAVLNTPAAITATPVFTLTSLDYAYTFVDAGFSTALTITGNINGGGTETDVVSLIVGGGFTTLNLNWANLTSVDLTASNWFTIDNVKVNGLTATPEP